MFDFDVYAICGDGDLMEGVSARRRRSPGHLAPRQPLLGLRQQPHLDRRRYLDHLLRRRRRALHGLRVERDPGRRRQRPRSCSSGVRDRSAPRTGRPTLIIVDSHIGWGSPHKQDTAAAHGEPLGEDEVRATKRAYGWPEDAEFLVPDGVVEHFAEGVGARGSELRAMGALLELPAEPATWPGRSSRCSAASFPRAGTPRSRCSRPTRRGWRPASRRTRS